MPRRVIRLALVLTVLAVAPCPASASTVPARAPAVSKIDAIVSAKLKRLGIQPAPVSSDEVFVRRVYLDVIGTLPTADEARSFLADRDAHKREKLIDALLERDEFADYWAMKWSDVLRVKSEYPINLWPNAVQSYHHWIRASIRANTPFDRFARDLLTSSGSNFREPPVNFYRAVQSRQPEALAAAVALTFMGTRVEHWPKARLAGMAEFFANVSYKYTQEWKEEIVFFDPDKAGPRRATFPDGTTIALSLDQDPRVIFADWLTAPTNPWFAPAIANRVWAWLLGRGITAEPDDMRPDNPPANPELLAYLAQEVVGSHYDLKHLMRIILTSATYQRSAVAGTADARADANFAHYIQRPLDAEVLIDAIDQITGGTEQYSSPIPEPFTFVPESRRTITLADGSITNELLKTFGRSPRDLGTASERDNKPTAPARLALLNSTQIQRKLEQSQSLQALVRAPMGLPELVTNLYMMILSRSPSADELKAGLTYAASVSNNRRTTTIDVAWALINSPEFLYRH